MSEYKLLIVTRKQKGNHGCVNVPLQNTFISQQYPGHRQRKTLSFTTMMYKMEYLVNWLTFLPGIATLPRVISLLEPQVCHPCLFSRLSNLTWVVNLGQAIEIISCCLHNGHREHFWLVAFWIKKKVNGFNGTTWVVYSMVNIWGFFRVFHTTFMNML